MILMRLDLVLQSEPVVRLASATGKKSADPFCQIRLDRGRSCTARSAVFKQRESGTPSGRLVAERGGAGKVCAGDPRLLKGKASRAFSAAWGQPPQ
jgi:hypothetical protein